MAKTISEEEVRKVLFEVKRPAIDLTLIDLGIIKDMALKNN